MGLPAALLARLKKRGIVQQDAPNQTEEVFAEDYDENKEREPSVATDDFSVKLIHEIAMCPNTVNTYHECNDFCVSNWGAKDFSQQPNDDRKRIRMLKKYPLPSGWVEVGDPESGRCYYWNKESDKVSWLPPQHPRAKITVSAEKLMATMKAAPKAEVTDQLGTKRKPVNISIKEVPDKNRKRKRPEMDDALDPMDPAAYSEVERGSWSTGLKEDTKTGVDSTATGPLFQQRPYPSPGDILRAQAASQQN